MTTIIGVDPSMAGTGIGVYRNGTACSMTVRTPPTDGTVLRWRRILRKVWAEWDTDPSTLMVIEQMPVGDKGVSNLIQERAGLVGLLRYGADARDIPHVLVNVNTLKKYATGNGHASKADMLAAARDQILGSCANDDEADGLWLAQMALDHYRDAGMWTGNDRRTAALDRVDWPLWTPKGWTK